MEALLILNQKINGTIKGRMVYNGKPTRNWISREESTRPTVSLESILATAVIDAHEQHYKISADVPNSFIQTVIPNGNECVLESIKWNQVLLTESNPVSGIKYY